MSSSSGSDNLLVSYNPKYMTVFDFEKHDYEKWFTWLKQNTFFALYASAIYLGAIHYGQKFMASKAKAQFNFRRGLVIWNFFLAILSTVMFSRLLPELVEEVRHYGMHSTFCQFKQHNIATRFWALVFTFSKILEFGDTFFLVVAKKPIQFLHWYHHVTVTCYSFTYANWSDPLGRWFALINSFVHSIMYAYYGFRSLGIKIPKAVSMSITLLQICQMKFGIFANIQSCGYNNKEGETACNRPYWACTLSLLMYASYFVLFANFFYHAYVKSSAMQRRIINKRA